MSWKQVMVGIWLGITVASKIVYGFSKLGDVALSKNNLAWSSPKWSDEFKIEFDLIINKQIPGSWKNLFHMTTGESDGASVPEADIYG